MVAVMGTYENGAIKLDKKYISANPVKVVVTFLEEVEEEQENRLSLSQFSFAQSQKNLEDYDGSLSNAVIEERRAAL